jgi:S1-C subfamily serine protease
MTDPWRHEGAAQALATRARKPRLRPFTFVLLALLVWVAAPLAQRSESPELMLAQARPPEVVAPTGELLKAYELARPATLRLEARCTTPFGGRQVLGVGTGFFFDAEGSVLTAYHVVDASSSAADCAVRYVGIDPDRREFDLTLVGFDAYMDLAVMQADVAERVPFIPLAARAPTPGTAVVAIGNSRGDFLEPRAGRVTRLGVRAGRADFADDTIELTNALAPGDSGGPVVNARGEAVGVVSYISFNPSGMSSDAYVPPFLLGLALPREFASYAVPVGDDSALVDAVAEGAQRDVPVIGFRWSQGSDYEPRSGGLDLGPRPGPIVGAVTPGGPADRAGLRSVTERPLLDDEGRRIGTVVEADVIVAVDGTPTPTFAALLAEVRGKAIGQTVELTVQRAGATYRIPLELGARRAVFAGNP